MVWDRRTGVPLYNALVWQDTRVAEYLPSIHRPGPAWSSCAPAPGLPAVELFQQPEDSLDSRLRASARASWPSTGDALFGTIDTFLMWQLTGGVLYGALDVTDVTNASRTQLMNLDTLDWDADLLAAFEIPRAMLPSIRASSERYGNARA